MAEMLNKNQTCRRLFALGLPHHMIHNVLDQVSKWKRGSGSEWTVSRIKSIKIYYLKKLGGLDERPKYVKFDSNGLLKGPFGSLISYKEKNTNRQIMKILSALMVYTAETSPVVTTKQWKKFQSSVESPSVVKDESFIKALFSHNWRSSLPDLEDFPSIDFYSSDPVTGQEKRVPVWESGKMKTCNSSDVGRWFWPSLKDYMLFINPDDNRSLELGVEADKPWLQYTGESPHHLHDVLRSVIGHPCYITTFFLSEKLSNPPSGGVGRISFIQEPGMKLRAVANPNRIIQWRLNPLKEALRKMVSALHGAGHDFTLDQEKGVEKVKSWMDGKTTVHSIDLSDATNHFPLEGQITVLKQFTQDHPDVELFRRASVGKYYVYDPTVNAERTIQFTKGQPLGLGPSFFTFTSSHCIMLNNLKKTVYSKYNEECDFAVVGDDVCIKGKRLNAAYRYTLRTLDIPISTDKSISSTSLAEFAGKVITRSGVFPQLKLKEVSDRSFVDVARILGPKSLGLLQPRQRKVISTICEIPDIDGGLGWNPSGKKYSVRLRENRYLMQLLEPSPEVTTDGGPNEVESRRFRFFLHTGLTTPALSFDAVSSTRAKTPDISPSLHGDLVRQVEPLWTNKPKGGVMVGDPRGKTTLEILESKIKPITRNKSKTQTSPGTNTKPQGQDVSNDKSSPIKQSVLALKSLQSLTLNVEPKLNKDVDGFGNSVNQQFPSKKHDEGPSR
jgi:hypothetical protein